jgi:6-pyruvoyltetrahydropterin/6-carboxytetrahydropterin synthase
VALNHNAAGDTTVPERFAVRLNKESLVFSAAHFITYQGDVCERLHGHNYGVQVVVHGPLDENHYVVDFIALRNSLQRIASALDHHVLLPLHHSLIEVCEKNNEVIATFRERRWVFPSDDCVLLPVANTTAELLARYVGQQLRHDLEAEKNASQWRLEVHVDENHGQVGAWSEGD